MAQGKQSFPLVRSHRRSRSGEALRHLRLPPLRPTQEGYLRSRPSFCLQLLARDVQTARNQAEHLVSLPPTNRWSKRENEPVPRTVSTPILWDTSKRLGSMVAASPVHPELMA